MASVRLPERDLRLLVETAGRCSDAVRSGIAVSDVLDAVTGLVRCDLAFWNWYHLDSELVEHALVPARHLREVRRAPLGPWLDHLSEHPIMSGRHGTVTAISDVLRGRELERTWLYQEALKPGGVRYEIGLELTHSKREMNVFVLSRGMGHDFSPRDRLVLKLIRPHVDAAVRHLTYLGPRLTDREQEVLVFVRDGFTNAQIARRLSISEATVAKHLEHIYAHTGARSRTHAVTLCHDLLPSD